MDNKIDSLARTILLQQTQFLLSGFSNFTGILSFGNFYWTIEK